MELEPKNTFEKFILWCKKHHLGWLALAVLVVAVFLAGRKSAGSGYHDRPGNSGGDAADLGTAGEQVAAAAAGVAAGAADLEHIAAGLEDSGDQLQPVVAGLEQDKRDRDRLEQLLLELRRRVGSGDGGTEAGEHLAKGGDRGDSRGGADSAGAGSGELGGR